MATNLAAKRESLAMYVRLIEDEVTEELRPIIDPEKLQDEVRRSVIKQVLQDTQAALTNLSNEVHYGVNRGETLLAAEAKALRYMGYLQSLLVFRNSQRLLAAPKVQTEEVF